MHESKHGETGVVGEGGGVCGAELVGKGLARNVQTNVQREHGRSAELQSSHPSTWHLTQSPLLLATGLSHLYMWRLDVQFSGWVENGLGLVGGLG